jgi:Anti-sigma factor NepR
MHTDAQVRKAGGRLSREDQRRLGDILQRVYDDVLRQGVPDRFKELLNELDRPTEVGAAERSSLHGQAEAEREAGHLVGAKALDNKGSR